MVPFCAKQGVERKISFQDFLSAMLSDYECAYACGLAAKKLKADVKRETPLAEAKAIVEAAIQNAPKPQEYREENLYRLIRDYSLKGFPEVPEEIPILLGMGLESSYLDG